LYVLCIANTVGDVFFLFFHQLFLFFNHLFAMIASYIARHLARI
jgi:hypothetical protein